MAKSIRIERDYAHSPAQVWQALTDPQAIGAWLMQTDMELAVGTRFQLRAEPQPGWRGYVDCEILEIEPERKLRYSWQGDEKVKPMQVEWTLVPLGSGTRLTLVHSGFEGVGGWFLRMMLGSGWKKMLSSGIVPVLDAIRDGRMAELRPKFAC